MQHVDMPPDTRARIMIGKFIRDHIFRQDYQTGRLSKQKLFKLLNKQIRYNIGPETGLSAYQLQKMGLEIHSAYLETEEYQAYRDIVYNARKNHMTPEQYFEAIMIRQESDRNTITGMQGYGSNDMGEGETL